MIQVLQASEGVDIKPLNASKSRPSQYRSAGPVTGKQEDLNVILASGQGGHMFCSTADKNICGTENDATVPLKNGQVEEDCSLSGNCDSKKQVLDDVLIIITVLSVCHLDLIHFFGVCRAIISCLCQLELAHM